MNIDEKVLKNMKDWMNQRDDIPVGWIYIGDDEERYILGQPGNRNLLIFGINPSTASPGDNNIDPTIRKVRKIAENDGFDGWIMVNIYPQRATDPKDLPKEANKELLAKNIKVLKALAKSYRIDRVWAEWGNIIDTRYPCEWETNPLYRIHKGNYQDLAPQFPNAPLR